jgi:hypothetical protein
MKIYFEVCKNLLHLLVINVKNRPGMPQVLCEDETLPSAASRSLVDFLC